MIREKELGWVTCECGRCNAMWEQEITLDDLSPELAFLARAARLVDWDFEKLVAFLRAFSEALADIATALEKAGGLK